LPIAAALSMSIESSSNTKAPTSAFIAEITPSKSAGLRASYCRSVNFRELPTSRICGMIGSFIGLEKFVRTPTVNRLGIASLSISSQLR
jgi:hypothetical protein